jgi:hypothetical protein
VLTFANDRKFNKYNRLSRISAQLSHLCIPPGRILYAVVFALLTALRSLSAHSALLRISRRFLFSPLTEPQGFTAALSASAMAVRLLLSGPSMHRREFCTANAPCMTLYREDLLCLWSRDE